jgi:hypothetical protein
MGIEPGRFHFSWISSAEASKFVDVVKEITEQVRQLGPATKLIKELPVLDTKQTFQPDNAVRQEDVGTR